MLFICVAHGHFKRMRVNPNESSVIHHYSPFDIFFYLLQNTICYDEGIISL